MAKTDKKKQETHKTKTATKKTVIRNDAKKEVVPVQEAISHKKRWVK